MWIMTSRGGGWCLPALITGRWMVRAALITGRSRKLRHQIVD
ncbi:MULTISPECIES: hypothetical protein [unclassified Microcoleus]